MPDVTLQGRRYHYERAGSGVPLLLFHGFPFTSESWRPQLDAPPAGFDLITPDHRGFGGSDLGDEPLTMDALAADGLGLLSALGLERAVIGGLSMGGYVALAALRRDPSRVKGLVLVDTQATADDEAGRARREATAKDVEAKGLQVLVDAMLPKLLAPSAPAELRARVEAIMRSVAPQAAAAASRGMGSRVDGRDVLARYAGPCLVIVGQEDVITPVEKARTMADLVAGSTLDVVPSAGHLVNLEAPTAFAAALQAFHAKVL